LQRNILLLGHITKLAKVCIAFAPSLADRVFIAMLLSDAPMPFCDIFPGDRGMMRRHA
jgi:hypothetical protein